MFPTIEIGPLHLNTYWAMYSLALVGCGMLGFHRLIQGGFPARLVTNGLLTAIWSGAAGAFLIRGLVFLLQTFILTGALTWAGGSAFVGMLIGGSGAAAFYCRRHKIPLGRPFDLGGAVLPLGQAIGRLGCFAAGCCWGRPTESWLGMYLPGSDGVWLARYPTQLMSAIVNLLIFIALLAVERYGKRRQDKAAGARGWPFDGFLFLLYVALYCIQRFVQEFLRGDARLVVGPVSWVHLYTVAGLLAATATILWNLRRAAGEKGAL